MPQRSQIGSTEAHDGPPNRDEASTYDTGDDGDRISVLPAVTRVFPRCRAIPPDQANHV
ncbi:hypothetical protein [Actinocrinis sp.]|uniref:hypothetical protein n=1 Tax=Actinocrinis sp. TaxID=1920516 RepID=UPI002C6C35A2|nr:hypothetical protein [Actinocrinis sp.]HXR70855.1 hypothetical protein [Actinocrinis sp.]